MHVHWSNHISYIVKESVSNLHTISYHCMTSDTIGDCEVVTSLAPEAAPPPCDAPVQLAGHPHLGYASSAQFVGISLQNYTCPGCGKGCLCPPWLLTCQGRGSQKWGYTKGEVSAVGFNSLGRAWRGRYLKPKWEGLDTESSPQGQGHFLLSLFFNSNSYFVFEKSSCLI